MDKYKISKYKIDKYKTGKYKHLAILEKIASITIQVANQYLNVMIKYNMLIRYDDIVVIIYIYINHIFTYLLFAYSIKLNNHLST